MSFFLSHEKVEGGVGSGLEYHVRRDFNKILSPRPGKRFSLEFMGYRDTRVRGTCFGSIAQSPGKYSSANTKYENGGTELAA